MIASEVEPGRHYAARVAKGRGGVRVVKALYVSVGQRVFVREVGPDAAAAPWLIPASKLWYEVARDGDRWRKVGNRQVIS